MNVGAFVKTHQKQLAIAGVAGAVGLAYYKRTHSSSSAGSSGALYQPPDQSGSGVVPSSGDAAALLQLDSDITRLSSSEINLLNAIQTQLKAQNTKSQPQISAASLAAALRYAAGLQAPAAPKTPSPAPSRTPVIASASSQPKAITVADLSSTQRQYFNAWTSAIARAQPPKKPSTPSHAVSLVSSRPTQPRGKISAAGVGLSGGRRLF